MSPTSNIWALDGQRYPLLRKKRRRSRQVCRAWDWGALWMHPMWAGLGTFIYMGVDVYKAVELEVWSPGGRFRCRQKWCWWLTSASLQMVVHLPLLCPVQCLSAGGQGGETAEVTEGSWHHWVFRGARELQERLQPRVPALLRCWIEARQPACHTAFYGGWQ